MQTTASPHTHGTTSHRWQPSQPSSMSRVRARRASVSTRSRGPRARVALRLPCADAPGTVYVVPPQRPSPLKAPAEKGAGADVEGGDDDMAARVAGGGAERGRERGDEWRGDEWRGDRARAR